LASTSRAFPRAAGGFGRRVECARLPEKKRDLGRRRLRERRDDSARGRHDAGVERILDMSVLEWLDQHSPDNRTTGSTPIGWESSAWIAHAIYETDDLPGDLSWNDLNQRPELLEALPPERDRSSGNGWSQTPKPGWRRLTWAELAGRSGVDAFAGLADEQTFAYWDTDLREWMLSWPINIDGASDGSLDPALYHRLVEHLVATAGRDAACFALYDVMATIAHVAGSGQLDPPADRLLLRGTVEDLATLTSDARFLASPTYIWATDRSWLIHTDYDRCATQVSGSAALINRLIGDPEIEAVGRRDRKVERRVASPARVCTNSDCPAEGDGTSIS
jgi:hypothetical protein